MKRLFLATICLSLLWGCAPWIPTGGIHSAPAQNIAAELPAGWMRLNSDRFLMVTRDGVRLQHILVERIHVNDALTQTSKKFRAGMLPQEQAEILLDNTRANEKLGNVKVLENKPAKIAGQSAFRLLMSYTDSEGLEYRRLHYGFMVGAVFYGIRYSAPRRHYFDRNLKDFEQMVATVRLIREG